jgi:hypothetical protein
MRHESVHPSIWHLARRRSRSRTEAHGPWMGSAVGMQAQGKEKAKMG